MCHCLIIFWYGTLNEWLTVSFVIQACVVNHMLLLTTDEHGQTIYIPG